MCYSDRMLTKDGELARKKIGYTSVIRKNVNSIGCVVRNKHLSKEMKISVHKSRIWIIFFVSEN